MKCQFCGKNRTPEGHDGCLGELIGVANACCGHGKVNKAYVQFLDGTVVECEDAIYIQKILKKNSINYSKINCDKEKRFVFLKNNVKFYQEEWNIKE